MWGIRSTTKLSEDQTEMICFPHASSFQRCPHCSKYRSQLFVERSRESKKSKVNRTKHDSHVNYQCLNSTEKDERMRSLENAKRAERQRNLRLKNVLKKKIEEKGVALNENDCDDVTTIFATVSPLVESYPESSIQRIFWEQQSTTT